MFLILSFAFACAGGDVFLGSDGKFMTKIEVVKALLKDPGLKIDRCHPVKLSDKMTVVKK